MRRAVDLSGEAIGWLSLRAATVAQADLTGLTIAEGLLGATLRRRAAGLTVNGFDVAALIWDEMVRRDPPLALTRSARLDDLRAAWSLIAERWRATDARAGRLGDDARDERVAGEWSYAETLRHLVFVTNAWIGRVVLGLAAPYHPASLPPSFLPDMSAVGIDVRRAWDFDEVLGARRDRQALVARLLDELGDEAPRRRLRREPGVRLPAGHDRAGGPVPAHGAGRGVGAPRVRGPRPDRAGVTGLREHPFAHRGARPLLARPMDPRPAGVGYRRGGTRGNSRGARHDPCRASSRPTVTCASRPTATSTTSTRQYRDRAPYITTLDDGTDAFIVPGMKKPVRARLHRRCRVHADAAAWRGRRR